tara:strand:- start:31 stop:333 length:303 start_codon:yes stop_codon:yes gene_type:complete
MLALDPDMVSRFTVMNLPMNIHPKDLAMNAPTHLSTHELQVQGMSCQHCVKAVTQAVLALDAQAQVRVDLPSGQVSVQTQLSRAATAAAIADEGYDVVQP